jgi:hypothetical protein
MKNLLNTKTGKWLQSIGFERVNYRFYGKLQSVGLCYYGDMREDLLCIEPTYYRNNPSYKLTGRLVTAYHPESYIVWCNCRDIINIIKTIVHNIKFDAYKNLKGDKTQKLLVAVEP